MAHTGSSNVDTDAITAASHNELLFQLLSHTSLQPLDPHHIRHTIPLEISTAVAAGRGLIFTQDVKPGQLLLSLPSESLLNPATLAPFLRSSLIPSKAAASATPCETAQSSSLSSPQALSLVLAQWRARRTSQPALNIQDPRDDADARFLQRFASTLPDSFDTVPLLWRIYARSSPTNGDNPPLGAQMADTPDVQACKTRLYAALLQALPLQSRSLLDEVVDRFDKDWQRVRELKDIEPSSSLTSLPTARPSSGAAQMNDSFSLSDFLWAWLCVNSRCIFYPLALPAHSDNFTLAPLLDMANHTSQASIECKVRFHPAGGLELYAPSSSARPLSLGRRGMRKGDECFITYGPHSNAQLLSEYGFVLSRVCPTDDQDGESQSAGDGTDGAAWTGNRYCEVAVNAEMERLFEEQSAEGERKIALLQDRGYWRDYTLHPYPAPAHPSHRLVPALRMLALLLPSVTESASGLATPDSGRHIDKTRRLNRDMAAVSAKVSSKTAVHVKAGVKRQTTLVDAVDDRAEEEEEERREGLEKWEATLTGYEEMVSPQNEVAAHLQLVTLCDRLAARYAQHTEAIAEATSVLESSDGRSGVSPDDVQGCRTSLDFVRQLVSEEVQIIHLVRRSASAQTEW